MTSVSTWVDRGREVSLIKRTDFADLFFVLNQERYAFRFTNVRNSSAWGRNYTIRPLAHSFDGEPLPPLSTYVDTDVILNYCKSTIVGVSIQATHTFFAHRPLCHLKSAILWMGFCCLMTGMWGFPEGKDDIFLIDVESYPVV